MAGGGTSYAAGLAGRIVLPTMGRKFDLHTALILAYNSLHFLQNDL